MTSEEQNQQWFERDKRLQDRLQALAESVELMRLDMEQWIAHTKTQDARFDQLRRSMVRGAMEFLRNEPEDGHGGETAQYP